MSRRVRPYLYALFSISVLLPRSWSGATSGAYPALETGDCTPKTTHCANVIMRIATGVHVDV